MEEFENRSASWGEKPASANVRLSRTLSMGLALLAAHWVGPALAQSTAPACFCLKSPEGSLIRGCERESKGPTDAFPTAACRTASGDFVMRTITPGWTRVQAGTPPCDPCPTSPPSTLPDRPRAPEQ
jgi:hypothetical protein